MDKLGGTLRDQFPRVIRHPAVRDLLSYHFVDDNLGQGDVITAGRSVQFFVPLVGRHVLKQRYMCISQSAKSGRLERSLAAYDTMIICISFFISVGNCSMLTALRYWEHADKIHVSRPRVFLVVVSGVYRFFQAF